MGNKYEFHKDGAYFEISKKSAKVNIQKYSVIQCNSIHNNWGRINV